MANQEFVVKSDSEALLRSADRTTAVSEQLTQEIEQTPDVGLARLMEEAEEEDDERLSKDEAQKYYQALKGKNVDS